MITLKKEYKLDNLLFYLGYIPLLLVSILKTSTINSSSAFETFVRIVAVISIVILCCKGMIDLYSFKNFIFTLLFLIILILTWRISGENFVLFLFVPVIFSKGINPQNVNRVFFVICMLSITIIMILSLKGVIPNLTYVRGNIVRNSFGIIYPTDFAAYIFYLVCSYIYMRRELYSFIEVMVIILIAYIVYLKTNARLDYICTILAAIFCYLVRFNWVKKMMERVKLFFPIVPAVIILILTYFYNSGSSFFVKIDELLSERLSIVAPMFKEYGIKPFGNKIYQNGLGGASGQNFNFMVDKYTFIDSAYLRLILMYGFIITLLILIYLTYQLSYINDEFLVSILIVVFISSTVEMHMLQVAYNPFFIMLAVEYFKRKPGQSSISKIVL